MCVSRRVFQIMLKLRGSRALHILPPLQTISSLLHSPAGGRWYKMCVRVCGLVRVHHGNCSSEVCHCLHYQHISNPSLEVSRVLEISGCPCTVMSSHTDEVR